MEQLSHVDYVTTNAHSSQGKSQLYISDHNEAVIKKWSLTAECQVPRELRKVPRKSCETETNEFGVKEPPESEEKVFRKILSASNSPVNQELDQSYVSSSVTKLMRNSNQDPTAYSQERRQGDTLSPSTRKLERRDESSNSAPRQETGARCWYPIRKIKVTHPQYADLRFYGTLMKSSRTCGKSWISQKRRRQLVSKRWRPTYWSGDCLCRQRGKPPFILDQITLKFWKFTGPQTSRNFRSYSISLRSWYWIIKQRFLMWQQLIGHLFHVRDLHFLTIKWSRGRK